MYIHKFDKKDVNVIFLGGSITEGAGASSVEMCYANKTGEWLKEVYSDYNVSFYNKGVGGTPSLYGLLRFDRDVAAYHPDLVFIEFAVNDDGNDTRKYVEGIVGKLTDLPEKPCVVFLYTTDETYSTETKYFEEVAEYYNIPQIYLKDALKKHLNGKNAREAGYFRDSVHPSDKGYSVYFDEIKRCLSEKEYYRRPEHKAKKLVNDSFYADVDFLSSQNTKLDGNWVFGGEGERKYSCGTVGDSLEFEFYGDVLSFEHGLHKDSAAYDVYIDGVKSGSDEPYWEDFTSNQLVLGFTECDLPMGKHKVKVVIRKSEKENRTNKQVLIYNILKGKKII